MLAILQGYNLEIRHILGKKNPTDSLRRQLVADALVRKSPVKNANAEYVQKLRVSEVATDQEIQNVPHQLFNSSPQGHSILTKQSPQGTISSTNDDSNPQGDFIADSRRSIIGATAISKIQLDNTFKNSLHFFLPLEIHYSEIFLELSKG